MKYSWSVIGGGPGGILSIAKLLDSNISGNQILWIDDAFQVGRIGQYYKNVPSNDTVQDWIDFLRVYSSLHPFISCLENLDPTSNENLGVIYRVFLEITQHFHSLVDSCSGTVKELKYDQNQWYIYIKKQRRIDRADKVILATGSHPIDLNYQRSLYTQTIPLDLAIDEIKLSEYINSTDTVAVIGSGQSAVLIMKYLDELGVSQTINLYKMTLEESVKSLKAITKKWAVKFLLRKNQDSIIRVPNTVNNREKWLPQCNKIIYAVGYERNPLPKIRGIGFDTEAHDGILSLNLFGVGIAFPSISEDSEGHVIRRVGFTSFTRFLDEHVPSWIEF